MKNIIVFIVFLVSICTVNALSYSDLKVISGLLSNVIVEEDIDKSVAWQELKQATPEEFRILQKSISGQEQKKLYSELSTKLWGMIDSSVSKNNFSQAIDLIHNLCLISYLSGVEYSVQEKIVRLSYHLFNHPNVSREDQQKLLLVLQRDLIMPTEANYREYQENSSGQEMIFYANKLLMNYFSVAVMEAKISTNNLDELKLNFQKKIKNISEELDLENSIYGIQQQNNIIGFYWVISQPLGFFYADQTGITYKVTENQVIK